jgi:hypothetical protein
MGESFGVNLFCQGESVAAGFGKAEEFFKPGGAGCLEMQA